MKIKFFPLVLFFVIISSHVVFGGVQSMDFVNIKKDTIFNSDSNRMWVVEWSATSTDKINGKFTPSEIQTKTGEKTKQEFSVEMTSTNEKVEYNFLSSSSLKPVIKVTPVKKTGIKDSNFEETVRNVCTDFDFDGKVEVYDVSYWDIITAKTKHDIYCVKESFRMGVPMDVSSPDSLFKTNWEFQSGNKNPVTFDVNNMRNIDSQISNKINNRIYIRWEGSYSTGYTAPSEDGILGLHNNNFEGAWKIIDERNYNNYLNYMENSLMDDIRAWANGNEQRSTIIDKVSEKADNVDDWVERAGFEISKIDLKDTTRDESNPKGKFLYNDEDISFIPNFQMFINADYLELEVTTGKPEIVYVNDVTFEEGTSGEVGVKIRNVGDGKGEFNAEIKNCENGVEQSSGDYRFNLNPGETTTHIFYLTGVSKNVDEEKTGICTIELEEVTTKETVEKDFSWTMKSIPTQCSPGEQFVDPDNPKIIRKCNEQGTSSEILKVCGDDEIPKLQNDGTYECVEEGDKDVEDKCAWWDIRCRLEQLLNDMFSGTVNYLFVILGGISALLGALTSRNFFRGYKKGNVSILAPIGIGIVLFALPFFNWAISLVIIIILIVVNFVR